MPPLRSPHLACPRSGTGAPPRSHSRRDLSHSQRIRNAPNGFEKSARPNVSSSQSLWGHSGSVESGRGLDVSETAAARPCRSVGTRGAGFAAAAPENVVARSRLPAPSGLFDPAPHSPLQDVIASAGGPLSCDSNRNQPPRRNRTSWARDPARSRHLALTQIQPRPPFPANQECPHYFGPGPSS